ncbi:MAG: DUF4010 domain-containing protein [Candidatus Micrarchaeia archaeon]
MENIVFLQQILLSIGVGALIGLEREHTKHQRITGLRTIALISLLGNLSVMISELSPNLSYIPYLSLLAVIGYTFLLYYFRAKKLQALGMTTVLTLPLAFILGIFVGFSRYIEAIMGAILATILLLSRDYSHMFVRKLTTKEIDDALLFGTICFIILPILPSAPITLFDSFSVNLQSFFLIVITVSVISLLSFLLLRFWGHRALPLTGFLGGLINSVATVADLASKSKEKPSPLYITTLATASSAMLVRNLLLVVIFSPQIFSLIFIPILGMIAVFLIQTIHTTKPKRYVGDLLFEQPFSVLSALKFSAVLFGVMLLIHLLSQFSPRSLGIGAFIGGLVSSASVAASISSSQSALGLSSVEAAYLVMIGCFASLITKIFTLITSASKEFSRRGVPVIVTSMLAGAILLILIAH